MKEERVEKLLAQILLHFLKEAPQGLKAHKLSAVGFTNMEIADLLGTTSAVVSQALYEKRKSKSKKSVRKNSSKVKRHSQGRA